MDPRIREDDRGIRCQLSVSRRIKYHISPSLIFASLLIFSYLCLTVNTQLQTSWHHGQANNPGKTHRKSGRCLKSHRLSQTFDTVWNYSPLNNLSLEFPLNKRFTIFIMFTGGTHKIKFWIATPFRLATTKKVLMSSL